MQFSTLRYLLCNKQNTQRELLREILPENTKQNAYTAQVDTKKTNVQHFSCGIHHLCEVIRLHEVT